MSSDDFADIMIFRFRFANVNVTFVMNFTLPRYSTPILKSHCCFIKLFRCEGRKTFDAFSE